MKQRILSPAWLLFVLSGLNLLNYLDRYLVAVLLEPIRSTFGLNDRQGGQLYTAFMIGLAGAIFLLFLGGGPVNTLIVETAPVNLRASAMALSILMIHLFGDFWSPEITGWLSLNFGLQRAAMALPFVLLLSGGLWLALALKTLRAAKSSPYLPRKPALVTVN